MRPEEAAIDKTLDIEEKLLLQLALLKQLRLGLLLQHYPTCFRPTGEFTCPHCGGFVDRYEKVIYYDGKYYHTHGCWEK